MARPITLYKDKMGTPNPIKATIFLEELGLAYKPHILELSELHTPVYENINPNGRLPAIHDPNTDLTLWESGAIIEYLIDTYDKENRLSYASKSKEDYLTKQWLYFQVSGQGPYFGQKSHFTKFHPEKLPSAITRYHNEIKRVVKVIDSHLKKQATGWLVGEKCTYADLSFIPWNKIALGRLSTNEERTEILENVPDFEKWHEALMARDAVAKVYAQH